MVLIQSSWPIFGNNNWWGGTPSKFLWGIRNNFPKLKFPPFKGNPLELGRKEP